MNDYMKLKKRQQFMHDLPWFTVGVMMFGGFVFFATLGAVELGILL